MKKYALLLLIVLPTILRAQLIDRLGINVDDVLFEKMGAFDKIKYGTDFMQELGKPELPAVHKSFVIPTDAEVTGIDVNVTNKRKLEGTYYVYPAQPPQIVGGKRNDFVPPDTTYNSMSMYPGKLAVLASDEIVQGYHVITIIYYPVVYLPGARELYVNDISITVNYQSGRNVAVSPKNSYNRAMLAKGYVKSLVENPEDVDRYYDESNVIPQSNVLNKDPKSSKIRGMDVMQETVPDYVIITCDSLKTSFKELAYWKTKKGVPTVIKTVEEIQSSYLGSDLVEKIRNYLLDAKSRWNGNSLFVLIGGDTNIVPVRMIAGTESTSYAADCYFVADNVSSWDPLTSSFGSTHTTSSYLGRIPVKNTSEAKSFIQKLLFYEKANLSGVNYSYFNNSLIADAYGRVSSNNGKNEYDLGNMSELYGYCKDKKNNYWYLFDHVGCSEHVHYDPGTYDKNQAEELTQSSFLSALTNGKSPGFNKFHFVFHLDHSMQTNMGTSQQDKGQYITNAVVDNLPDDYYPKVMMSAGCHPASFSKDCIAEHFLNKPHGGAVAFIGNADVGYFTEARQLGHFLKAAFSEDVISREQYSIGYLFNKSLEYYLTSKWRLHLLGDPEMPVWTAEPKSLQVNVTPTGINNERSDIGIQVTNLPVGQKALICLMKEEEGYATLTVSDTKVHHFDFTPRTTGLLHVTVTAHNFKPFEGFISVIANDNRAIRVSELKFYDDQTGGSMGNGDGQLDAGETIEFTIKLKNSGKITANVIGTMLSTNRPDLISIPNDAVSFENAILPNGEIISPRFNFKIKNDIGTTELLKNDFNSIKFYLDIAGEDFHSIDTFKIDVFAPKIEIASQYVDIVDGDALYSLSLVLVNTGKSVANGLVFELMPDPNGSLVASCPVNTGRIRLLKQDEELGTSLFTFRTKDEYKPRDPMKMLFRVTDKYGKIWELPLDPLDKPNWIDASGITVKYVNNGVGLYWKKDNKAAGYNIYRSSGETNDYIKLNKRPVSLPYFEDENITPLATYYYKVEGVSASGNKGSISDPVKVSGPCSLVGKFPRFTKNRSVAGGIAIADMNNDGYKEIAVVGTVKDGTDQGFLSILNYKGEELFNENDVYLNGIGSIPLGVASNPSIGNLYGDGEQQVVTVTWKDSSTDNMINCFAAKDVNGDKQADMLWQNNIGGMSSVRGTVVANLDNSEDGSMEVLVRSNIGGGPLKVLTNRGALKTTFGESGRYSRPAVTDLDGDGDMEIIVCYDTAHVENNTRVTGGGMYIWHHDGRPYGKSPFWGKDKSLCSPVVCRLEKNGPKVIIVGENKTADSRIYAINLSGIPVSDKWNGKVAIPYSKAMNSGLDHLLSVGDINGDGALEVVALGTNYIRAWNNKGDQIFSKYHLELMPNLKWSVNIQAPILADVDGDGIADVIYTYLDKVFAIHGDSKATNVAGFPLETNMPMDKHICVADIDYDGKNELVALDSDAQVFTWKTNGKANAIEWGSERHDLQNTGEHAPVCEAVVIQSNTIWDGISPCGNIIVRSGKFTIPVGKRLALNKNSKIVVRPGATLEVDGGIISNANILAVPGSSVILKNNGVIQLRNGGKFTIDQGAIFENQYGAIDVPN